MQAALGLVEVQIFLPVMFTLARHSLEGYQCGNAIEVHVFFVLGRDLRAYSEYLPKVAISTEIRLCSGDEHSGS